MIISVERCTTTSQVLVFTASRTNRGLYSRILIRTQRRQMYNLRIHKATDTFTQINLLVEGWHDAEDSFWSLQRFRL